jgi:hypothetical protein
MARIKCPVCKLWRGHKPHSAAVHARIRAARKKLTGRKR